MPVFKVDFALGSVHLAAASIPVLERIYFCEDIPIKHCVSNKCHKTCQQSMYKDNATARLAIAIHRVHYVKVKMETSRPNLICTVKRMTDHLS